MPAVWTYPWNMATEGVDETCERLARAGIDGINIATHYNSVRTMQPRFPDTLFVQKQGGGYFEPDEQYFEDVDIEPVINHVDGLEDPLGEITATAADHDMDVNAWVVCLHNTALSSRNPDYRFESAFGDTHDHALCPANPETRAFFAALVRSVADYGVNEIQLERLAWPNVFHNHGSNFGHDKHQIDLSPTEEVLLSQCFCDACEEAAADHHVDLTAAKESVQSLLRGSLKDSRSRPIDIAGLVQEHPELQALFEFRQSITTQFIVDLAAAADDVDLNHYVMVHALQRSDFTPGDGWPFGVRLDALAEHLDRLTAMCYVPSEKEEEAVRRLRTLRQSVDVPVDVGISLAPYRIGSEAEFVSLVETVKAECDGKIMVYNDGIATDAQLDWLDAAF